MTAFQVFARIGAFVGVYSVSGLLTQTLTTYVNSQVMNLTITDIYDQEMFP